MLDINKILQIFVIYLYSFIIGEECKINNKTTNTIRAKCSFIENSISVSVLEKASFFLFYQSILSFWS